MATITVSGISCEDLKNVDTQTLSDPLVVVSVGGIKAETKHIWNDLNPTFPESLQLKLPANTIYPVTVDVAVEDFDKHSDNDPLGNTKFTILGEGSGTHSGKLQDIEQGSIKLSWTAVGGKAPSADRTTVAVSGIKLRDLPLMDTGGTKTDPYVLLVVDGVESKPTATIWNTHDPDFPETLQLELAEGATYPYDVEVRVMDEDVKKDNDFVGAVNMTVTEPGQGSYDGPLSTQGTASFNYVSYGGPSPAAANDDDLEALVADIAAEEDQTAAEKAAAEKAEAERLERLAEEIANTTKAGKKTDAAADVTPPKEAPKEEKKKGKKEKKGKEKKDDWDVVDNTKKTEDTSQATKDAEAAKAAAAKAKADKAAADKAAKKAAAEKAKADKANESKSDGEAGKKFALIGAVLAAILLIFAIAINCTTSNLSLTLKSRATGVEEKHEMGIWLDRRVVGAEGEDAPHYCNYADGGEKCAAEKDTDCCEALESKCYTNQTFAIFSCFAALCALCGIIDPTAGIVGGAVNAFCNLILFSVTASLHNNEYWSTVGVTPNVGAECGLKNAFETATIETDVAYGAAFVLSIFAFLLSIAVAVLFAMSAKASGVNPL